MFKNKLKKQMFCVIALLAVFGAQSVFAQTTAFTYQGKLNDGGNPANASYDMQFRLFDVVGAGQGTQQGATIAISPVAVSNGNFSVGLDFGAAVFASGADRFLEISIRPAGNTGGYTLLAPRQKLTSTPYSVRSINANSADALSSACVGCVQNSKINSVDGSKVTGTVANATNAATANDTLLFDGLSSGNFVQFDGKGNVGIGTTGTGSKLTVEGVIESTEGGLKFPDATVQTTAGLTGITTDTTLTGNGTIKTPLGIASPLLVRDMDNPAFQSFQASTTVTGVFVTVPDGKILVIEFVAGYQVVPNISGPGGPPLELLIPSANTFYYIAPQNIALNTNNYWHYYSQQTRIYLTAGQQLRVNWITTSSSRYLSVSGYYVNAPK
jgi:hypothetical protein